MTDTMNVHKDIDITDTQTHMTLKHHIHTNIHGIDKPQIHKHI